MCRLGLGERLRLCFSAIDSVSFSSLSSIAWEAERCLGRPRSPSSITLSLWRLFLWVGCGCGLALISTSEVPLRRLRPRSRLCEDTPLSCAMDCFCFCLLSSSPHLLISTGCKGRSFASTGTLMILSSVSCPDTILPNTVCLSFRWEQLSMVMKNL